MKFVAATGQPHQIVELEEDEFGVFITVNGDVVVRFQNENDEMIIDESNLVAHQIRYRVVELPKVDNK